MWRTRCARACTMGMAFGAAGVRHASAAAAACIATDDIVRGALMLCQCCVSMSVVWTGLGWVGRLGVGSGRARVQQKEICIYVL